MLLCDGNKAALIGLFLPYLWQPLATFVGSLYYVSTAASIVACAHPSVLQAHVRDTKDTRSALTTRSCLSTTPTPDYAPAFSPHWVLGLQFTTLALSRPSRSRSSAIHPAQTFNDGTNHQSSYSSRSRNRQPWSLIGLTIDGPRITQFSCFSGHYRRYPASI
jgi:hypothetical protein